MSSGSPNSCEGESPSTKPTNPGLDAGPVTGEPAVDVDDVDDPGADGDSTPGPLGRLRPDRVWTRAWIAYDEESRQQIRAGIWCAGESFYWRFGVMMITSAVIAAVGLNLSSAAVVIGAMLVAPLMTPIVGLAAAAAGGNGQPAARCAAVTVAGSVGVVLTAYVTSALLDGVGNPVTPELLARTSPDVRDLAVAIAAGTAGAYATTRTEISASLPGAAVAVALVPPLAAAGICFELGRSELAFGALLLFAANLIGILVASAVVMSLTGFAEPPYIRGGGRFAASAVAASAVALVVVTLPLLAAVDAGAAGARRDAAVQSAVATWAESNASPVEVRGVKVVDGNPPRVEIELVGAGSIERPDALVAALTTELDSQPQIELRWADVIDAGVGEVADEEATTEDPLATARTVLVDEGLHGEVTIEAVTIDDGRATVDLAGSDVSVVDDALRAALATALVADELELRWTNRYGVESEQLDVDRRVREWARRLGVEVLSVRVIGDGVEVSVAAAEPPTGSDVADLEERLEQSVDLRWAPLLAVPIGG